MKRYSEIEAEIIADSVERFGAKSFAWYNAQVEIKDATGNDRCVNAIQNYWTRKLRPKPEVEPENPNFDKMNVNVSLTDIIDRLSQESKINLLTYIVNQLK